MTKLTLLGAGKIGEAIIHLLGHTGDYRLRVVDADAARLAPMKDAAECIVADISKPGELDRLDVGPKGAPEHPFEEALDLALDCAKDAH